MRSVDMRSVELKPEYLLREGYFYKRFYKPAWMSEKAFKRWLVKREVLDRMTGRD
jgi:hypothetical protein